jgi:hypothetical protein
LPFIFFPTKEKFFDVRQHANKKSFLLTEAASIAPLKQSAEQWAWKISAIQLKIHALLSKAH